MFYFYIIVETFSVLLILIGYVKHIPNKSAPPEKEQHDNWKMNYFVIQWQYKPCIVNELLLADWAISVPVQAPPHVTNTRLYDLFILFHPREVENTSDNILWYISFDF